MGDTSLLPRHNTRKIIKLLYPGRRRARKERSRAEKRIGVKRRIEERQRCMHRQTNGKSKGETLR